MKDADLMPFGKYKGTPIGEVQPEYLLWLYENNVCYGSVYNYIRENLEIIKMQISNKAKGIK